MQTAEAHVSLHCTFWSVHLVFVSIICSMVLWLDRKGSDQTMPSPSAYVTKPCFSMAQLMYFRQFLLLSIFVIFSLYLQWQLERPMGCKGQLQTSKQKIWYQSPQFDDQFLLNHCLSSVHVVILTCSTADQGQMHLSLKYKVSNIKLITYHLVCICDCCFVKVMLWSIVMKKGCQIHF